MCESQFRNDLKFEALLDSVCESQFRNGGVSTVDGEGFRVGLTRFINLF